MFSASASSDGDRTEFDNEVAMLVKLSHPNILQCFGTSVGDDGNLYQILEFCGGGTLHKYALESEAFTTVEFARVIQETLGGVAFLHERHVSHRDLKPENILLLDPHNRRVKIAGMCLQREKERPCYVSISS